MAKLKVDLDVLQATINTYNVELGNLKDAKKGIQRALNTLKSSGWDSAASKAWFSLLDDEWLKNIEFQIRVLERLRDNLDIAKDEYQEVYEEQQNLKNYL
jgi:WXG100 family type VII secretion target